MDKKFDNGIKMDWDVFAKKILALNNLGIYITQADGHYWIQSAEEELYIDGLGYSTGSDFLCEKGISLNNKIYGGFVEAVNTVFLAFEMAGHKIKLDFEDIEFTPRPAEENRISIVKKGCGGID
jgi:hypothetical protein